MAQQAAGEAPIQNEAEQRSSWSGKWGFILAGAASAVGLGNLWRFPYLAAKYGGGIFILVYILLVVTCGTALMIAETALGRKTGQSTINAFSSLSKKWKFLGILASIVPFVFAAFYVIICGWVTKYMVSYLFVPSAEIASDGFFTSFIMGNYENFLWAGLFLLVTYCILALGVNKGIEGLNRILMPILLIISLGMAIYAITLPGALEGVAYYLTFDFSKLSLGLVVGAMGQMFFSLSLAIGIMITYGSYYEKSNNLLNSVYSIEFFDTLVAILAGLMIIPASFAVMGSAQEVATNAGPSLMFAVLPMIFDSLGPVGPVLGFVFFLLVCFAAITSLTSICEAGVAVLIDGFHLTRNTAIIISAIISVAIATFINLGYTSLSWVDPMYALFGVGENGSSHIFDFFDFMVNTILLPIVGLLTCIFVGYAIKPEAIIEEVEISAKFRWKGLFTIMIKYVAPLFLVIILVSHTLSTLGVITI